MMHIVHPNADLDALMDNEEDKIWAWGNSVPVHFIWAGVNHHHPSSDKPLSFSAFDMSTIEYVDHSYFVKDYDYAFAFNALDGIVIDGTLQVNSEQG